MLKTPPKKIILDWKIEGPNCFHLCVPCKTHLPGSTYDIYIQRRPDYCDRGDWKFIVDGINDVDEQDGFPRYFFGSREEAMKQMETWLFRRKAFREANGL